MLQEIIDIFMANNQIVTIEITSDDLKWNHRFSFHAFNIRNAVLCQQMTEYTCGIPARLVWERN